MQYGMGWYGTLILVFALPWNQKVLDGAVSILRGVPSTRLGTFREEPTALQTRDQLSRIIHAAQRVYKAQQTHNPILF